MRKWLGYYAHQWRKGCICLICWAGVGVIGFTLLRLLGAIFPSLHDTVWHDAERAARWVAIGAFCTYVLRPYFVSKGLK